MNISPIVIPAPPAVASGFRSVAIDPTVLVAGDSWFNSTSGTFKGVVVTANSWVTGGNVSVARRYLASAGGATAGLAMGGIDGVSLLSGLSEAFDGSVWTTTSALNQARSYNAGCGSQSAALTFGGYDGTAIYLVSTETFNGSVWSVGGSSGGPPRRGVSACGTPTAAINFAGTVVAGPAQTTTEKYNAGVWTASGALGSATAFTGGCGTQSSALHFGGQGDTATTESWGGATWSVAGNLITGVTAPSGSGRSNTDGMVFGGSVGGLPQLVAALYNGVAWTATTSMAGSRYGSGNGSGTNAGGLAVAGYSGGYIATTEMFGANLFKKTFTLV